VVKNSRVETTGAIDRHGTGATRPAAHLLGHRCAAPFITELDEMEAADDTDERVL
jgi:hypothetical protein